MSESESYFDWRPRFVRTVLHLRTRIAACEKIGTGAADPGVETELRIFGSAAGQTTGRLYRRSYAAGVSAVGNAARDSQPAAVEIDSRRTCAGVALGLRGGRESASPGSSYVR